jgi:N-acetylglucosaminyl-diphospho-decaprenol L-rhamnosyltransferase
VRSFTAVVVTWNSGGEIPGLVESVRRHLGPRCDLLFVDSNSQDETVELIRAHSPESELIALDRNVGFGPANNLGVSRAKTEVVCLLNPDTLVIDDSLAGLAELAAAESALFGPRLLNGDRTWQISAFPPVAGWESTLISFWPGALLPRRIRMRCEPWRYDERLKAGWLSGACLVARRDLLRELGPFDESLPLYGEDSDLALRAWRRGIPSVFAPDVARIVHLGSRSGTQAFDDVGTRRKLQARRWIVRTRYGRVRASFDLVTQFSLYGLRWLAKTGLRRDASIERMYVRALFDSARIPLEPKQLDNGG